MPFEAIIGLEIHVQMKTKSKMFSSAPVSFGDSPNTNIAPLDMAFPGAMPTVNKQAVINAIRVCHALNMSIDHELWFDRKNYFYSDLAKGYQITQQARPIGLNGYLDIKTASETKRVGIKRLHLEEDTCKQLHQGEYSLLDYNRSGIPLIEIVTMPDLRSGEEAKVFLEKIRSIVTYLEVSNGKMEEGSLRCDVNISLREVGNKEYGTKVEIKNLNSVANVKKAIDYEMKRQERLILDKKGVLQETRRFDETRKETRPLRAKMEDVDYKYFTDPNIIPIILSDDFIETTIKTSPELADSKCIRYKNLGLSEKDIEQLIADKNISNYYDEALRSGANAKLLANWVLQEVLSILNKNTISIQNFIISPNNLGELVIIIEEGKVSNKQAKEIFKEMLNNNASPMEVLKKMNISAISDETSLLEIVIEVINENPKSVTDYKNGKDRVIGYLVGQILKKSQGKANPKLANELVIKELRRR